MRTGAFDCSQRMASSTHLSNKGWGGPPPPHHAFTLSHAPRLTAFCTSQLNHQRRTRSHSPCASTIPSHRAPAFARILATVFLLSLSLFLLVIPRLPRPFLTATRSATSTFASAMTTPTPSPSPSPSSLGRPVVKVFTATKQLEGGGFEIRRPFPSSSLPHVDPFLLFDHLGPMTHQPHEAIGAPDHPHRGFVTVTYLLQGSMEHQDSFGHKGKIRAGGVQWMTAGSGLIHAEMPSHDLLQHGGTLEGYQIWINLPAKAKGMAPRYQELEPEDIPEGRSTDGKVVVKVVGGEALGVKAKIDTVIPVTFVDVRMQANATFWQAIPEGFTAVAYCYRGRGYIGAQERPIKEGQCAEIDTHHTEVKEGEGGEGGRGSEVRIVTEGESASFIVLAGQPIREPIARHGPFVMNTQAEVRQAFVDYQNGKMGHLEGDEERMALTEKAKRVKAERMAREWAQKRTEL